MNYQIFTHESQIKRTNNNIDDKESQFQIPALGEKEEKGINQAAFFEKDDMLNSTNHQIVIFDFDFFVESSLSLDYSLEQSPMTNLFDREQKSDIPL